MPDPDPALIHARGLTKRFGDFTAVDAVDFDVAPGESFGFLGPNGAGKTSTMRMIGCVSPMTSGDAHGHGHGPHDRRPEDPRAARRRPAAGHARHRADRPREPAHLRSLLRSRLEGDRPARRRADRVRPADGARQRRGRTALGRHEATPDDRPGAHQRTEPAPPRRAHDGPRPAGASPPLGPAVSPQATRRHPGPDDPLHGRGRAAVRPAGRDGQGEDRRRGQPAVADRAVLDPRGDRAPLRSRASPTRSTAGSTGSPSGSSISPTGSCSTRTTARRPSRPSTSAGSDPRRSSSAGPRSRTCSSGSPVARSSIRRMR